MLNRPTIQQALASAEYWNPEDVLDWAFSTFGDDVEIASAFGPEGIVLLDFGSKICQPLKVFTIDTGFFFAETEQLISALEHRYGIAVERVLPSLGAEDQEKQYGAALWKRDPDLCCQIRKIEPLHKKLSGLRAWITAIRRTQTAVRASARKIEWDTRFNCWKINPLVDWTDQMVWEYIRSHDLAYNPLHDRNFTSIGCTHCTRAVRPGEDPRAGRWSGFRKTECGLHSRAPGSASGPLPALASSSSED